MVFSWFFVAFSWPPFWANFTRTRPGTVVLTLCRFVDSASACSTRIRVIHNRTVQTHSNIDNSRRLWLFPGSVRGFSRKTPGKSRENSWKFFPESRNATNSRISGTGKGKPAGNLGSTLPGPCPHLLCGVFFEIDSSSLLEFFLIQT